MANGTTLIGQAPFMAPSPSQLARQQQLQYSQNQPSPNVTNIINNNNINNFYIQSGSQPFTLPQ